MPITPKREIEIEEELAKIEAEIRTPAEREDGVDEALIDITRTHGINWLAFKSEMHVAGRYHVEVY